MSGLFAYAFLQRALVAGLFIGVACAVLGVFLLLRKDAMIGHGLSHVTFAGVALGLFAGVMPLASALAVSILGAVAMMKIRQKAGLYGDAAIAILSSVGLAAGIILAGLSRSFSASLLNYLFGEILAIAPAEVGISAGLALAVIAIVIANYHRFMFATFDRESARVAGIAVGRVDTTLTVLTAVTIVLGMKVAGLLLVSALLVLPAAAALQIAASFRAAVVGSGLAAIVSVGLGLAAAVWLDLPASGTIVASAFLLFAVLFAFRRRRD